MKIIVTHASPDLDAITSVWLIKKFLPGWNDAHVEFVPAGERLPQSKNTKDIIETIGGEEVIHVDTGLGPLDHHQTSDENTCAASLTWDFVKTQGDFDAKTDKTELKKEAISRMVKVAVEIDHFKEVFWDNPNADHHEFSLFGIIEGIKNQKPNDDMYYVEFTTLCLDALLHNFENKIWAEQEIKDGVEFTTKFGKGLGIETINDSVLKVAQKMGYAVVVRKDPRKGYVRIKALPDKDGKKGVDLTNVYHQLSKMDPEASWFLHVSKKMLLNGTPKNPKMIASKLTLREIISVVEGNLR